MICDGEGRPLVFLLTPGNIHDATAFDALFLLLLAYLAPTWRKRLKRLVGDKGYDAERIVEAIRQAGLTPVIPKRRSPMGEDRSDSDFDRESYRQRNHVERCLGHLKEYRWVATRYDKLAATYGGMVRLAMIRQLIRAA